MMLLPIFAIINGIAKNSTMYVSFWTYTRAVCKKFFLNLGELQDCKLLGFLNRLKNKSGPRRGNKDIIRLE